MHNLWFGKSGLWPNGSWPLRYLLPYQNLFYTPAKHHDEAYSRGGTEEDRENIDKKFLHEMLEVSKNNTQRLFAKYYFLLFRKFGRLFFNHHIYIWVNS